MSVSYIGIGSNLGTRQENCSRAVELVVEKRGIKVQKKSSLYETEPWGVKDQPRFINMVVQIETTLKPNDLLRLLKDIEREIGRQDSFRWGPRMIDLDILLFNALVLNEENLQIPHPCLHEREFVLRPLNEIAPDIIHPVFHMSIDKLTQNMLGGRDE
jgi:2-amino-4-hydroxy-6-hydroxymethyldihydropteridine diphosphokinase